MSYTHSTVSEPEFEQAKSEIFNTLAPLFKKRPELENAFKVLAIPERIIQFRVTWEDDKGNCQVNNGFRVQFSSVLGPYKGGLRLHPSVNLSILKFLGFEQIFKNALTGLHMGGGKGGSDFDPKGKSDSEIRRFCVSFMRELSRHIGQDTDVPAGDIGVGGREVGFLFGAYKQIRNEWVGVLTGKGYDFGGSKIRPEATGYGCVYYAEEMIRHARGEDFKGKRVVISGAGNVAQFAALKVIELGGVVCSLSDSKGALVATGDEGLSADFINEVAELKLKGGYLKDLSAPKGFKYEEGARPWKLVSKVDVALPSATQNELDKEDAEALLAAGCGFVAEGANMPSTLEAIEVFEASRKDKGAKGVWYGPGKAANCGGVAVSGLEMAQNSARLQWTEEEVDQKLKDIMVNCFNQCLETAQEFAAEGELPSLVSGANISGFTKVVNAAAAQGDVWF
ncbi:hypothetical protein JCM3775_001172 [Rhodotorula graminis]|uniref:Glutamate dehydrogenase n=1 Tax=Rhodotorula graminis (strain WP1) TaxID=578459 RepID=A0A194SCY8_RHOGW|nr:uncharacterized protein RHOBADRAFT_50791 [Rhodotorula graminis WP1]KPV78310.1 hypothetical protein RHOBADRAFT_50791 [Rhodotorula graminis WP1]